MNRTRTEELAHEAKETTEQPAGPLRDDPSEPRTRIVGMKWRRLGVDADPEWGIPLFLYRKVGDKDCYAVGDLHKIESLKNGKQYEFQVDNQEPDTFTHYAVPTIPGK